MKNLRPIFIGALVALCLAAQPVAAATYDIALKLTASTYRVHLNGTLNVTATATNKGPDAGPIFISFLVTLPEAQSGLVLSPMAGCSAGSSDGAFCEFGTVAPGQSVGSSTSLTAVYLGDAWFVACATSDVGVQTDPIARNDCAMVTVRVLP
jgi:hypothetical protein